MEALQGNHTPIPAFPTWMVASRFEGPEVEALNQRILTGCYRKRIADPTGIYRSNAAGCWHSDDHILKYLEEDGQVLGQMFFQSFNKLLTQFGAAKGGSAKLQLTAWAMMMSHGGYSTTHTHPNCLFSGVYYVAAGPEKPAKTMATGAHVKPGSIEFMDMRGARDIQLPGLVLTPQMRFAPKNGLMLVFPSNLPHFVHPVEGEGDRLSIACNAKLLEYTPPAPTPPVADSKSEPKKAPAQRKSKRAK